jgi:hypothetical protein
MNLFQLPLFVIALVTLTLIIIFNVLGQYYRQWQLRKNPGTQPGHLGAIEGSLLGLLTLMLAFSYGIAATRYEVSRQLIIDESKIITQAVHRTELYPDSIRDELLGYLKDYVDTRINYYVAGANEEKVLASLKDSRTSLDKIRHLLMTIAKDENSHTWTLLMIPSLDNIEDIVLSKEASRLSKLPSIILWTLLIMAVASSFLVGFVNEGRKNSIMIAIFALMTTAAFYLVIELDHPRLGFINQDVEIRDIISLRNLFPAK